MENINILILNPKPVGPLVPSLVPRETGARRQEAMTPTLENSNAERLFIVKGWEEGRKGLGLGKLPQEDM